MNHNYEIFCPSNRPNYFVHLEKGLQPIPLKLIQNFEGESFSQLVNRCFAGASSEIVIVSNDKARPTPADVKRICSLLEAGYGFVGLFRMGFFGMRKDLFEAVGQFDNRFVDGGYEDNDWYLRLKFHDIAIYLSEEIEYLQGISSTWSQKIARKEFFKKYQFGFFSKSIFFNADLNYDSNLTIMAAELNLKKWDESVYSVVPLGAIDSKFEIFLKHGVFVKKIDKCSGWVSRLRRALKLSKYWSVPNIFAWRNYSSFGR